MFFPYSRLYHTSHWRNLRTGGVIEKTFQGYDKVEDAEITKSDAQYLYKEGGEYYFMDSESYEQFFLSKDVLGDRTNFLIEGTPVTILNFNGVPINVELPIKMKLRVIEAPPGIKGDTVSAGTKTVILETGASLSTPLFVKAGDDIIVNTEIGQYTSRA